MADRIYRDQQSECWLGDCLDAEHVIDVMGDRLADLVCVDAPYSSRTHSGHKNGKLTADRAAQFAQRSTGNARVHERAYAARKAARGESGRRDIEYTHWTPADVRRFCDIWIPRCKGWLVSITDDVLAPAWRTSCLRHDLYPFAPLPLVETGSRVRMTGDGPSNWTCWIVVARPRSREFASWGTLDGAYVQPGEREINSLGGSDRIVGGKPLKSMLAIVRDYSRPGALVVDPCAGGGTTLVAAKKQGRRCIGMDVDPKHTELTAKKLSETREQTAMPWAERQVGS